MLKFAMTAMTPDMVRRFWALVDEVGHPDLMAKADDQLVRHLLSVCQQQHPLSNVDAYALSSYISARVPLIRDVVLG